MEEKGHPFIHPLLSWVNGFKDSYDHPTSTTTQQGVKFSRRDNIMKRLDFSAMDFFCWFWEGGLPRVDVGKLKKEIMEHTD